MVLLQSQENKIGLYFFKMIVIVLLYRTQIKSNMLTLLTISLICRTTWGQMIVFRAAGLTPLAIRYK